MKMIHIMAVPFTGLGRPDYRGDKWLRNRITVFKRFVVPSLMSQTKREFIVWCQWRPQEKYNQQVRDLMSHLESLRGMRFVHTFEGINLWDDKYPDQIAHLKLINSLKESLPLLEKFVGDSEWVYLTCQPSDDMYSVDYVELIQQIEPEEKLAVLCENGYMMNYATKEICEYNPRTTPPFATICFPSDVFLDAERHMSYIGAYRSHEEVPLYFNVKRLDGRLYMVGTHGENISTVWNHPYSGREILGGEHISVMAEFGCLEADPVVVHRRIRLWGRMFVNALPKPLHDLIRNLYNSLRSYYFTNVK